MLGNFKRQGGTLAFMSSCCMKVSKSPIYSVLWREGSPDLTNKVLMRFTVGREANMTLCMVSFGPIQFTV